MSRTGSPGEGALTASRPGTKWAAFFVSDSTGITAETLGNALLANFPEIEVERHTLPFVDDEVPARNLLAAVERAKRAGCRSVMFTTVKQPAARAVLAEADAVRIDLLEGHLGELERLFGMPASERPGRFHGLSDAQRYFERMRAVEFAIEHDDGQSLRALDQAEVVLIAPSRCGKTPTTMYLALQHGLLVANYPLTEDDFGSEELPRPIAGRAERCFGLTSTPLRLSEIRQQRRANSRYASLDQCAYELRRAEELYRRHGIPHLNSSTKSVEEMSAVILQTLRLRA